MYLLIDIGHNILMQRNGIILRWKMFIYMHDIDILRKYHQKYFSVSWKVIFEGFCVEMAPIGLPV